MAAGVNGATPSTTTTVVVAGGSGFIGTALIAHLTEHGTTVRQLVRREPQASHEFFWEPRLGELDTAALRGASAVVNLSGAGVGDHRWTQRYRNEILRSRVGPTTLLARTMAHMKNGPSALVQASAMGYYGDRGDEELTEESTPGEGFLTQVVEAWEAAAQPAQDAGLRVAFLRMGLVLDPAGGALAQLLPLIRLGLGGRLGSGNQWWSWITLTDAVRAFDHLINHEVAGPVNGVTGRPDTQIEVVSAFARELHRPAIVPVPAWALKAVLGGFSIETLASHRIVATRLLESGFAFDAMTLTEAVGEVLT